MKSLALLSILLFSQLVNPHPRLSRIFVKRQPSGSIWLPTHDHRYRWFVYDTTGDRPWPVIREDMRSTTYQAGLLWGSRDGINGSVEFMPVGYVFRKGDLAIRVGSIGVGTSWLDANP